MSSIRVVEVLPSRISGVYLLAKSHECSYYIGQSNDLVGRLLEHKGIWQRLGIDIRMVLLMEIDGDGSRTRDERIRYERRFMAAAMHLGMPLWNSERTLPYYEEIKKKDLSIEIEHLQYAVGILRPSESKTSPVCSQKPKNRSERHEASVARARQKASEMRRVYSN